MASVAGSRRTPSWDDAPLAGGQSAVTAHGGMRDIRVHPVAGDLVLSRLVSRGNEGRFQFFSFTAVPDAVTIIMVRMVS